MNSSVACLAAVSVKYDSPAGPVLALQDVTIDFVRATSTAILGRSGAGKSTLVSVLALLRRPTSGEVRFGDVSTSRLSSAAVARLRASEVGIVFQAFHLETSLTAAENILLPWYFRSKRESHRSARRRVEELLELLNIGALGPRHPNEMSGGQRQRVAIARALFLEPRLFIADEPTGNLDEETANSVAETILALPSRLGTTVLLVTHDRVVASRAARRFELVKGRLSADNHR